MRMMAPSSNSDWATATGIASYGSAEPLISCNEPGAIAMLPGLTAQAAKRVGWRACNRSDAIG
jgi:hypothetical protein